jgi:hypothetical protein
MSEDLVNQLTLSYMISKQQLAKLNKRIKEDNETFRKSDKEIYRDRMRILFNELLNNDKLDNIEVTEDVKYAFNFFMDKSIYYFKQKDMCEDLEKQRNIDDTTHNIHININNINSDDCNNNFNDELDLESEDKYYDEDYKSNDSLESDNSNNDSTILNLDKNLDKYNLDMNTDIKIISNNKKYIEDMDTYPDIQPTLDETQNIVKRSNITTKKKVKSEGVENIDDIQVNWFQNVQQQYKSNKIIPRKKDIVIAGHYHNK